MLNATDICDRLRHEPGHPDRLSIVPRPSEEILKKRGGTSVDLRLGRWFRSFKPSKSSEARLWLEDLKVTEAAIDEDHNSGLPAELHLASPARDAMRTS